MKNFTLAKINAEAIKRGINLELVKGSGYFYCVALEDGDGGVGDWCVLLVDHSIMVYALNHDTFEGWLAAMTAVRARAIAYHEEFHSAH